MLMYRRYALIPETARSWRIWDTRAEHWCGKFLQPDNDYRAASRDVAAMRVRDRQPARSL